MEQRAEDSGKLRQSSSPEDVIVKVKMNLLPFLENQDRCNLFDSCRCLRFYKQTEYDFSFNRMASMNYATDATFRELVHRFAAVDVLRSGKRRVSINLSNNQEIADVSMLGEVMRVNLTGCHATFDVNSLGEAQMLDLTDCWHIANVERFIERLIETLNSTAASAGATDEMSVYGKECAAFTLGTLAFKRYSALTDYQDLIEKAGGIRALIAVLNDESDRSSVLAKELSVTALYRFAKYEAGRQLIAAEGGIIPLISLLKDTSDDTCEIALHTLFSLATGFSENLFSVSHNNEDSEGDSHNNDEDSEGDSENNAVSHNDDDSEGDSEHNTVGHNDGDIEGVEISQNYAEQKQQRKNLIFNAGGVDALIAVVIDQRSDTVKEQAVTLLFHLVKYEAGSQRIIKESYIENLLNYLFDVSDRSDSSMYSKEEIVRMLPHVNTGNHVGSIITTVLQELRSSSHSGLNTSKRWAAAALQHFANGDDEETKQQIVDRGGIPALVALLSDNSDGSMQTKDHASKALTFLARDSSNRKQSIGFAGGIGALVNVLNDALLNENHPRDGRKARTRENALYALYTLAFGSEDMKQPIVDAGGIKALVTALGDDFSSFGNAHASYLLSYLAFGSNCRQQLILEAGAIPRLITLAKDNFVFAQDLLQELVTYVDCAAAIKAAGGEEFF